MALPTRPRARRRSCGGPRPAARLDLGHAVPSLATVGAPGRDRPPGSSPAPRPCPAADDCPHLCPQVVETAQEARAATGQRPRRPPRVHNATSTPAASIVRTLLGRGSGGEDANSTPALRARLGSAAPDVRRRVVAEVFDPPLRRPYLGAGLCLRARPPNTRPRAPAVPSTSRERALPVSKRTFQPNTRRRAKTHGFRLRMSTRAGRAILAGRPPQGPRRAVGLGRCCGRRSTTAPGSACCPGRPACTGPPTSPRSCAAADAPPGPTLTVHLLTRREPAPRGPVSS
jgi:large subunit ribosomal protein L34